jgi:hypothetical protein
MIRPNLLNINLVRSLLDLRLRSRGNNKTAYYLRAGLREIVPGAYFRATRESCLKTIERYHLQEIINRVDYYNKIESNFILPKDVPRIREISFNNSTYFFDLREFARYYDPDLRLPYVFGDVREVPKIPSIVKSRPISNQNANSVLMKLNKQRHYFFLDDPIHFEDKRAMVIWRGTPTRNPLRAALLSRHHDSRLCDIGHTRRSVGKFPWKPFVPIAGQLRYKYVLSVEGNDVATNLKWILASNSLCLMPAPRMETWFMEGCLVAGHHYVQLRDDFSDLEEKILYYERHTPEALEIMRNAKAHVAQFNDYNRERLISLLVLQKYFEKSGQLRSVA